MRRRTRTSLISASCYTYEVYPCWFDNYVIIMLAFFGNLFSVFVIWRESRMTKNKFSPLQLLLLHTCVADILYAIFALGTEVAIIVSFPDFYGGIWLCKLVKYLQAFPMYASAFLLVAISADRYQAVCRPLAHYLSDRNRHPNYLARAAWCLALICSLPRFYFWELKPYSSTHKFCVTIFENHEFLRKVYFVYSFTVAWLLPSMTNAGIYFFVCRTVWLSKCTVKRAPNYIDDETKSSESHRTHDYVKKLQKESLNLQDQTSEFSRKRIQTVRLTLIIAACNLLLRAPYWLMSTVVVFVPDIFYLYARFYNYIMIFEDLYSCVNPWIYILFNRSTKRKRPAFRTTSDTPVRSATTVSECTTASTHLLTAHNSNILKMELLGSGVSATVYKSFYKTATGDCKPVAVKTLNSDYAFLINTGELIDELKVLRRVQHLNIVAFIGYSYIDRTFHIVTEYMAGGSLYSYIKNDTNQIKNQHAFDYMDQILSAMVYLTGQQIVHRDLAARNCLLNHDFTVLKVADFGLARSLDYKGEYQILHDNALPTRWIAIEAFSLRKFTEKTDVWSFGVLIWELFSRGDTPYDQLDTFQILIFLKEGRRLCCPQMCPEQIYALMITCWDGEPEKRPSFKQLQKNLKDRIRHLTSINKHFIETGYERTNKRLLANFEINVAV